MTRDPENDRIIDSDDFEKSNGARSKIKTGEATVQIQL
jgi:hypothetical protein